MENPQAAALVKNPNIPREKIVKFLSDLLGKPSKQEINLLQLLAQNNRLGVIPALTVQYEALRSAAENQIEAELISAFEVTEQQQQKIAKSLKKRLGREVILTCTLDKSLIAGAIIRAGDFVVDGTVQNRLNKLALHLSA